MFAHKGQTAFAFGSLYYRIDISFLPGVHNATMQTAHGRIIIKFKLACAVCVVFLPVLLGRITALAQRIHIIDCVDKPPRNLAYGGRVIQLQPLYADMMGGPVVSGAESVCCLSLVPELPVCEIVDNIIQSCPAFSTQCPTH